jgi:hypothetical protein
MRSANVAVEQHLLLDLRLVKSLHTTGLVISFGTPIYFNAGILSALGGCGNDCRKA